MLYGQLVTLCNVEAGGVIVLRGIYACIYQLIVQWTCGRYSRTKLMSNFAISISQNQQKLLSQTFEFACPSFSFIIIINNIKITSYYILKIM